MNRRRPWSVGAIALFALLLGGCGATAAGVTRAGAGGDPPRAASRTTIRSCGSAPHMIQNHVMATRSVGCAQARRLMHELLGGSQACYPHGYTAHPRCRLEGTRTRSNVRLQGFRCSATYDGRTNVSRGRCVEGRRLVTGMAGP